MSESHEVTEHRKQSRRLDDRLHDRVTALENTTQAIKAQQELDSAQLDRIEGQAKVNGSITEELIEVLNALKGAGKVVGWVAKAAKPLGAIATLVISWHTLGGAAAVKAFAKEIIK